MKLTLVFTLFLVLMGAMTGFAQECDCPETGDPVCGGYGKTYPNACIAKCKGGGVAYNGPCNVGH